MMLPLPSTLSANVLPKRLLVSSVCRGIVCCVFAGLAVLLTAPPVRASDTFGSTGSMATARAEHSATRLQDGRVMVAGGENATGPVAGAEIYDPATGTWDATGSLHTPRSGHTAVLLQTGRVLVVGGRNASGASLASAELFDPATGVWTVTGSMSVARRFHTANLLSNGRVLVVGGALDENGTGALESSELYHPASGSWTQGGLLTAARGLHTTTMVSDTLIIFGGMDNGAFVTTMEQYDGRQSQWGYFGAAPGPSDRSRKFHTVTRLPNYSLLIAGGFRDAPVNAARLFANAGMQNTGSLSAPRFQHTATMLPDGRVIAIGGRNSASEPTGTCEIYRQSSGTWVAAGNLANARSGHTATPLVGGRVLVTGGMGSAGALSSCEMFTSPPAELTEAGLMLAGRQFHRATLLPNGHVLVSGGFGWGQSVVGTAEVYDPTLDQWRAAPGATPRAGQSSTLLPSGTVLVTGGYSSQFGASFLATSALYDPARNQWAATGQLSLSRAFHCAALLPDGKVLVAGGYRTTDYVSLSSAEVYDPATGAWSPTAPMMIARNRPVAILLTNGKVLVFGGSQSAELYDPQLESWSSAGTLLFPRYDPTATLLPDGRVLVAGGNDDGKGTSEIYDPVANSWSPAATMTTDGFSQVTALLYDGRVLSAGNYSFGGPNPAGKAEIYDPTSNTWTSIGKLTTVWHTLTQLKGRRILIAGGELMPIDPATPRARLFDVYSAQGYPVPPVIASAHMDAMDRVVIAGRGFTTEPSVAPVVQLRRLDNGQSLVLTPDASSPWSESSFVSQPLTGFPRGHFMVTVFAGGVPETSVILEPQAAEISVLDPADTHLATGEALVFGSLAPGSSTRITLTLRNDGRTSLTGLGATISGRDASAFSFAGPAIPESLDPSLATTLTLQYSPSTPGAKTAMLRVASSDADEGPFEVRLSGIGTDSRPTISVISDQTLAENETSGALGFTIGDSETPASGLTVSATSSNPDLVAPAGIVIGGSNADRTLTLTPVPHQSGSAVITVTVGDGIFQSESAFTLAVTPVNAPPTIDSISPPADLMEGDGLRTLTITGVGPGLGDTESVSVSAHSSNPALIPDPVVTHVNPASSGIVTFTPVAGMSGFAVITVSVSDGQAESPPTQRTFTLHVRPLIRLTAATAPEDNEAPTSLAFRIHISAAQAEPVEVQFASVQGTATAGEDFQSTTGTAVIPSGSVETTIPVTVNGDSQFELDESFTLVFSNPVNGFLEETAVIGTVINDDPQPPLTLTAGSVTESPDSGPFLLWVSATLPAAQSIPVTWQLTTRAGTAQAGTDFTPLAALALTFAPGETVKWISIQIPGDGSQDGETDEVFYVDFTSTSGPASTTTASGSIRPLTVLDFRSVGNGLYALRFPTGNGQRYVIEESLSPAGPWTLNSPIFLGTGSPVTQVVFSLIPTAFFRVVAAPSSPEPFGKLGF
jgi:hypothetical protein